MLNRERRRSWPGHGLGAAESVATGVGVEVAAGLAPRVGVDVAAGVEIESAVEEASGVELAFLGTRLDDEEFFMADLAGFFLRQTGCLARTVLRRIRFQRTCGGRRNTY